MDNEARKIARHHLGERLHWIGKGGPTADEWIVQAWPDTGHMIHAQAATVAEAAADCAAQLRAAGWTPSHARLEWERFRGTQSYGLFLRMDNYKRQLLGVVQHHGNEWGMYDEEDGTWTRAQLADLQAVIGRWHAANLPSLHLPPFPGASDAS